MSDRISGDDRYDEVKTDVAYLYDLRRAMDLIIDALGQTPEEIEDEKQDVVMGWAALRKELDEMTRQRDLLLKNVRKIENIVQVAQWGGEYIE